MNIEIRPMQSFIVRLLFMPMFLCPAFVSAQSPEAEKFRLLIVDPGHFHASLVQKSMYPGVDSNVYVFAPDGSDLKMYLDRIEQYNSRTDHPTRWNDVLYTKPDYFEKMIAAPPVDPSHCIMVVSGNNSFKTERIKAAVDRKIHVFADKPCVTTPAKFDLLLEAFESAKKNDVILYDIMTERFEIATILQRELMLLPAVFGELETGTLDNPAVEMVSVHHFCKLISGKPLVRPAWFYDTEQYGEGLVDITTHLVDLVQWACFPEQILDYKTDVAVMKAKRFATPLTPEQFKMSTGLDEYPEYLRKDVKDGVLYPNANGVIHYTLKGVHAKVASLWNFIPPEGTEDTHFSSIRGTKSRLVIRQDETTGYVPRLTIEPTKGIIRSNSNRR